MSENWTSAAVWQQPSSRKRKYSCSSDDGCGKIRRNYEQNTDNSSSSSPQVRDYAQLNVQRGDRQL
jgi:hypothetical protein